MAMPEKSARAEGAPWDVTWLAARFALRILQVAAYQLGLLLPKEQQPLPMSLFRIGDSSSHIVPNGGEGTDLLMVLAGTDSFWK